MTTANGYGDLTLFWLLRVARPYWPHIGILFLLGLLSAPLALLTLLPLKIAVDSAFGFRLLLIAMTVSPFFFVGVQAYGRRLRPRWSKVKQLDSSALPMAQVVLSSLCVLQEFGQKTREGERFVLRSGEERAKPHPRRLCRERFRLPHRPEHRGGNGCRPLYRRAPRPAGHIGRPAPGDGYGVCEI